MKLYNSLVRKVEDFKPRKPDEVTLYSCGPTVYDHIHIGNLRAFIVADLLRRVLDLEGNKVKWVMNITDVDDKTIHRSAQEYPTLDAKEALTKLTRNFEAIFYADVAAVGVDLDQAQLVRATDSLDLIRELITDIDRAGFAYEAERSVYFDLKSYTAAGNAYGLLTRVDFVPQARINNDEYDKHQAQDFVLWKAVDPGEPAWDFGFQGQNLPGRPGWHIECSAMSTKHLGQPFDIHTGGIDLIFPHHENEIAQSQAAKDLPLARCFVHNEHLLIEHAKMSKSLQNFFTLADIKSRQSSPLAFRLLMLSAHYRTQQNFTWEALAAAHNRLLNLYAWSDQQFQTSQEEADSDLAVKFKTFKSDFGAALADDLDTPAALAHLSLLIDWMGQKSLPHANLDEFIEVLTVVEQVFGLGLGRRSDLTGAQKALIKERQVARQAHDYATADQIREKLVAEQLEIDDTPAGARWRRLS